MAKSRGRRGEGIERRFESPEVLQGLLELAGCPYALEEVAEVMKEGLAAGQNPGEVIPTLFDGEPRFPDPSLAPRFFGNLLGLWDALGEGKPVLAPSAPRPPRPGKVKAAPPAPFSPGSPDASYVEAAQAYLTQAPPRELERLEHAFENREDALLGCLDGLGLSDEGYGTAREACFALFAMMQLGWPAGTRGITGSELEAGAEFTGADVPAAFRAVADRVEPDVRVEVTRYLNALWSARR